MPFSKRSAILFLVCSFIFALRGTATAQSDPFYVGPGVINAAPSVDMLNALSLDAIVNGRLDEEWCWPIVQ